MFWLSGDLVLRQGVPVFSPQLAWEVVMPESLECGDYRCVPLHPAQKCRFPQRWLSWVLHDFLYVLKLTLPGTEKVVFAVCYVLDLKLGRQWRNAQAFEKAGQEPPCEVFLRFPEVGNVSGPFRLRTLPVGSFPSPSRWLCNLSHQVQIWNR